MTPAASQQRSHNLDALPRHQQPRTGAPLLGAALFRNALIRERKRADRSNQPLALVLVALQPSVDVESAQKIWRSIIDALSAAKRETDALGWFEKDRSIGLLLPEVPASAATFSRELSDRVGRDLSRRLDVESASRVSIGLHIHPGSSAADVDGIQPVDPLVGHGGMGEKRQTPYDIAKRGLDVALSAILLAVLSPLFLLIAALIKLTSSGPVFFRQERVGQMMKPFMMLKFRTMHVNADSAIHHRFVSSFITSGRRASAGAGKPELFKIANDPRVTTVGNLLRRTSIDELPQFWNVLRGDMSLVGPRPPLAYEVEQYQSWHRRRVLEAKPGVTGLWQVTGRSRTTFDEMVRLDLRYAKSNSVWTDIKILLATPRAVISGKGAC